MASQRPSSGLQRGRKRVILGSKIDFSEIDPRDDLRAWGAQKTHFYGDLRLFWPTFRPFQAENGFAKAFQGLAKGPKKWVILGQKIDVSEIDPEGGLGAWGAQKTHFYGDLSLFWPTFRPF